jgi:hypothetical protein
MLNCTSCGGIFSTIDECSSHPCFASVACVNNGPVQSEYRNHGVMHVRAFGMHKLPHEDVIKMTEADIRTVFAMVPENYILTGETKRIGAAAGLTREGKTAAVESYRERHVRLLLSQSAIGITYDENLAVSLQKSLDELKASCSAYYTDQFARKFEFHFRVWLLANPTFKPKGRVVSISHLHHVLKEMDYHTCTEEVLIFKAIGECLQATYNNHTEKKALVEECMGAHGFKVVAEEGTRKARATTCFHRQMTESRRYLGLALVIFQCGNCG